VVDQASDIPDRGIWLFRASRLEALLDPLLALLDACPPAAVLTPQTVIVGDPGMRQWLLGALARKRGTAGIVANLDVALPGAWLDGLAQAVLGEQAVAARPYRREWLRWRVHDALASLDDARLQAGLRGPDAARRRFGLADRLARILIQYLVYRPDWLESWAAGRSVRELASDEAWLLAPVWRAVRAAIDAPHRGERIDRLIARLERGRVDGDDTPLHVFGISHLAPADLRVLQALARHRLVVAHVPDPCHACWSGMTSGYALLRDLAKTRPDDQRTEEAFLQSNHPLLGGFGRIGQHFLLLLEDGEVAVDERHYLDREEAKTAPLNLLQWLQEGIRRASPGLPPPARIEPDPRKDRSLRVHACHTRLRELEVLRDALLMELRDNADLKPSDILVMAPDIRAYAPLLPAVFGAPGRRHGPLPWHLADVPVALAHPLFDAFARLLDLPSSRLTAPEIADLVAMPPIAARLGLGEGDVATLVGWLREARVAWGLDASFRERFGVPAIAAQTLGWGIDRLLAGYAMGEGDEATQVVGLPDDEAIVPLPGIAGAQAALAGALDVLLVELASWCEAAQATRRAGEWADWLDARCDALLRVDPDDIAARDVERALRATIRRIASEPEACGLDPPLAFAVVRDLLLAALAEVPARQVFLSGAVTFCGMVAQRAIPFRVVAVLGLDAGALPRAVDDAGLDPMRDHRRIGDRDVRNDDRWLFLQTLMSARDALHLSYVGEGVRDGRPRNPAAPLAELIALLDPDPKALPDVDDDSEDNRLKAIARRPWFVRHPLQPFDARYFDGKDPALFSFSPDFAALDPDAEPVAASPQDAAPRAAGALGHGIVGEVSLRELIAWFRDPAKHYLMQRVRLRLDALDDDRLRESESLDAGVDPLDRVARRVFLQALADPQRVLPEEPPPWLALTGALPPGRPGAVAWKDELKKVNALLQAHAQHPLFAAGVPARERVAIDVSIDDARVRGEAGRVHVTGATRWVFDAYPGKKEDALDLGLRAGLFLEWALLRLSDPDGSQAVRMLAACAKGNGWQDAINAWDEDYLHDAPARAAKRAGLEARVLALLRRWSEAQERPPAYYPKTSLVAVEDPDEIEAEWIGSSYRRGERDYAPGYAHLLAGETHFAPGDPERASLIEFAMALKKEIDLRPAEEGAAT
jgi:exodeoxyribonuclease V gamma subunit